MRAGCLDTSRPGGLGWRTYLTHLTRSGVAIGVGRASPQQVIGQLSTSHRVMGRGHSLPRQLDGQAKAKLPVCGATGVSYTNAFRS